MIAALKTGGFRAECPSCDESFALKDAGLFFGEDLTKEALAICDRRLAEIKAERARLKALKASIPARSQTGARTTNLGFIYERLAPTLEGFKLEPNDCRSLFDPIDYVVFDGLTKTGRVRSIVFMDVKSGDARLSAKQKTIKQVVDDGRVAFQTYEASK